MTPMFPTGLSANWLLVAMLIPAAISSQEVDVNREWGMLRFASFILGGNAQSFSLLCQFPRVQYLGFSGFGFPRNDALSFQELEWLAFLEAT